MLTKEEKLTIISRFEQLPTGNLVDAMERLGLPYGVIQGLYPNDPNQKRAAGFAVTIQQRAKRMGDRQKGKTAQRMVINTMLAQGDMMVIDAMGRMDVCTGGGLLALRAKMVGASGFVVNGCLRDVADIRKIGFPVYLKGCSPRPSACQLETAYVNEPVVIGSVQIQPGDLIVMDDSGCVVIKQKNISAVQKAAEIIFLQERRTEELLLQGEDFEVARKMGAEQFPWE